MNKSKQIFLTSLSILFQVSVAQAQDLEELSLEELMNIRVKEISLPDVPHVHSKGEFMVAYHLMNMQMKDQFSGSNEISVDEVLSDYMVTPTEMPMTMHMFHLMYGWTDKLTIMAMGGFQSRKMDHITRAGGEFTTKSQSFSDLTLGVLYTITQRDQSRLTGLLGLRLPLGSIDEKDVTPASAPNEAILPYPMQLGSGTIDPLLGLTYLITTPNYGWGGDLRYKLRTGKNDNGYRFGDELKFTLWYSRTLADFISLAAEVISLNNENIDGSDARLNANMVYTADPNLRAGSYILGGLVLTYHPTNAFEGLRVGVEVQYPFYRNLEGPQLAMSHANKVALTYVFGQK